MWFGAGNGQRHRNPMFAGSIATVAADDSAAEIFDGSNNWSIDGEAGIKSSVLVRAKELCTPLERSKLVASIHRRLVPVVALALGGLVIALAHRLSRDLDYHAIIHALRHVPVNAVILSVTATALSFIALIGREIYAVRYAAARAPAAILLIASFCGNALGNAVGFGALSGGAVRYRLYRGVGMAPGAIGRIVAFIAIGSGVDIVVFTAASSLVAAPQIGGLLHLPVVWTEAIAWLIMAAALVLMILCVWQPSALRPLRPVLTLPTPFVFIAQLVLTGLDVVAAAAALWVLLPTERVALLPFATVFAAATGLGALSLVPAGLGVFEAVVIFGLSNRVSPNEVVAAILAYRGIYFLLPLLLSTALLAVFESRSLAGRVSPALTAVETMTTSWLTPKFIGVAVFAVGVMLMISGATPSFGSRLVTLQTTLPIWLLESAHFIASLDGVILLFVVQGLFRRLNDAWWVAVILVLTDLGLSLAKGLAYGEAGIILFILLMLLACRRQFSRRASMLSAPITPGSLAAIVIVIAMAAWILFFAFRDTPYTHDLWWQFEFDAQAPRALRALVGASILALGIAVWQLLRPASGNPAPPTADEMVRAEAIIGDQDDGAEAMLALMGDKSFLFSRTGKSMLMYGKHGRSWIALYDPVGCKEEWREIIWRFIELADDHGGRAAFHEVSAEALPLYLDAGLTVMKIGEDARIDLRNFRLEGARWADLRNTLKRGERDGFAVEITEPPATPSLIADLRAVSDVWLHDRRSHEMAFSVAGFHDAFVAKQYVASLRQGGKTVAFVSLMTTAHSGDAAIGLMRHLNEAPPYAMRFLFARVILHLKAAGFERLSLGMAPFSGLEQTPLSSLWHRIGGLLWSKGNRLYNFQGVRTFKEKFHPSWEPRYQAASGMVGPFIALIDVAALTHPGRPSRSP
jgi:phosphatidylglycerol lysyltransferase